GFPVPAVWLPEREKAAAFVPEAQSPRPVVVQPICSPNPGPHLDYTRPIPRRSRAGTSHWSGTPAYLPIVSARGRCGRDAATFSDATKCLHSYGECCI